MRHAAAVAVGKGPTDLAEATQGLLHSQALFRAPRNKPMEALRTRVFKDKVDALAGVKHLQAPGDVGVLQRCTRENELAIYALGFSRGGDLLLLDDLQHAMTSATDHLAAAAACGSSTAGRRDLSLVDCLRAGLQAPHKAVAAHGLFRLLQLRVDGRHPVQELAHYVHPEQALTRFLQHTDFMGTWLRRLHLQGQLHTTAMQLRHEARSAQGGPEEFRLPARVHHDVLTAQGQHGLVPCGKALKCALRLGLVPRRRE
mmetsp:Transcript_118884/g.383886  ORF Transcript_118884/g.383886 Transcript_118884/m.383886 type:complete len:257 (+) Transcript_118884:444-1214(+)